MAKENELRIKQLRMKKEIREKEREHELKVLQLLAGQPSSNTTFRSSSPFNMSVSVFLPSYPIPAMSQTVNESHNTNFSVYPISLTPTYFKL